MVAEVIVQPIRTKRADRQPTTGTTLAIKDKSNKLVDLGCQR